MNQLAGTKEFVLCFDGTGYRFRGDEADSNVLKIYRKMLDRNDASQFHYYQPGIGTYTSSIWLSHENHASPFKKWYSMAKDAAFGSTFEEHIMAGYRYLMRFYCPGDKIYFFGFSRGAYVARLLAEMLDHIGLLEVGNEGKVSYIWSVFARWAQRSNSRDAGQKEKDELYRYMKSLRETFCRPISQIRFLGLFDTINSIPHFEMNRNKFIFPYTAKTSAKVIRHAVSIDEHRTKFREDLLSDANPIAGSARARPHDHQAQHVHPLNRQGNHRDSGSRTEGPRQEASSKHAFYRPATRSHRQDINVSDQRMHTRQQGATSTQYPTAESTIPATTSTTVAEQQSVSPGNLYETTTYHSEEFEDTTQDIEEVWFPGCHADIGGGLELGADEDWALSHVPLVWMVHEAQRAGLQFDPDKLKQFHCFDDSINDGIQRYPEHRATDWVSQENDGVTSERSEFEYALWRASTNGQIHDSLRYHHGFPWPVVLSWKIMEYFPFRRISLRKDGSWKPIKWPLPLGERRDIPRDAKIHTSAIRRLEANSNYRPRNLIRGGKDKEKIAGGSEAREWEVHAHHGCPVRETYHHTQMNKMAQP